ncbi:MAG: hypothetical protein WB565_04740 [Acidimicrobiales bacterium]
MRIVYEAKFGCGPPGDGDWDGATLLYAVEGPRHVFVELGQGRGTIVTAFRRAVMGHRSAEEQ